MADGDALREETLTLKNGVVANAAMALFEYRLLSRLQKSDPERFAVVLRMAHGEPARMSRHQRKVFQNRTACTDENGNIRPLLRDVLLSSYTETAEGPVLANPFAFRDARDRELTEDIQRGYERSVQKWIDEIRRELRDEPPSRG